MNNINRFRRWTNSSIAGIVESVRNEVDMPNTPYRIKWKTAKWWGRAYHSEGYIIVNAYNCNLYEFTRAEIELIVLHELAHIAAPKGAGHGPQFRSEMARLVNMYYGDVGFEAHEVRSTGMPLETAHWATVRSQTKQALANNP